MGKKKKVASAVPAVDPVDPAAAPVAEPTPEPQSDGKTSVSVTWSGGKRVYSLDLHGKDFKALAKEFAEKKGGKVA